MNKILLIIITIIILIIIIFAGSFFLTPNPWAPIQIPPDQTPQQSEQNSSTTNYDIQGMKVEIIKQGTGEGAKSGDAIIVNYTGTLLDGTKFDSSLNPGRVPFPYTLGQNQVIQGWELGLLGMKTGEERKLTIPPELAYGAAGRPPVIPQNATLIFDITMLSINGK